MGNANFMPLGLAVVRDDLFYLMEPIGRVYQYEYDPEYTVVEEEIKVVSILPNEAVEMAVTELAREHREITVEYEYLIEDTSLFDWHLILSPYKDPMHSYSNYEDVMRSLYASIAAGNGPDVLLLDDLDASALIKQGMLADLNEFVDTSVVYPALCEPFAQDGKQYGLPTWFYPWIVASWGDMPKMDTFDDFKNAVLTGTPHVNVNDYYFKEIEPGHYTSTDEPTAEIPEGVHFSFSSYGELFSMMYLTWKEQLLTGDRAVIEAFLQLGKQLGEHMDLWPFASSPVRWNSSWIHHFKNMDANMACSGMISPLDTLIGFSCSADEALSTHGHAALLPDTQGNTVCQPNTVAAIPATSRHKEAAALFIEALLSESVQTHTLITQGFPAVPDYVQAQLEQYGYDGYGSKESGKEDADIVFALEENLTELFGEIELCIPDDPVLESRFLEEAGAYWEGQKTLDEAVDDICNMMQTMQAEQQ